MNGDRPKCSILVLAYNHENFIAEALDGILAQVVDFKYEVFVAEDCSTDRTQEIILRYAQQHPDKIKYRFHAANQGGKKNFVEGYTHLRGDYVHLLDGDDYWTDPRKLQMQVDFLEKNPDYVGCAHNVKLTFDTPGKESELLNKPGTKETHTIIDLIDGTSYFHVTSLLFRNVFRGVLPPSMWDMDCGDWFLSMIYAEHGKIRYFPDVMAVYRIHQKGAWSGFSKLQQLKKNIDGMVKYDRYLNYKYRQQFTRIWWACNDLEKTFATEKVPMLERLKYRFLRNSIEVTANPNAFKRRLNGFFHRTLSRISW